MRNNLFIVPLLIAACSGMTGCSLAREDPAAAAASPTSGPPGAPLVSPTAANPVEPTIPPTTAPTQTPAPTATPLPPTSTPSETPTPAAGIEDASAYTWAPVIGGLVEPVGLENAGDGSGRLFILEQTGSIRVLQNGNLLDQPFLDLRNRSGSSGSEQGLLGLAFHPNFAENGFFYVNYIDLQGDTVIARYQVSETDPNSAQPGSETPLLRIDQPYANHNGGSVVFGPDGYLYLGLGDGGSAGDPQGNGQSLATLLGKILRIDVDGGSPYLIPPDNPYAEGGGRAEIWAYGLRNPWRIAFDRMTGDLFIGDVGQNQWEEIDLISASQVAQVEAKGQAFNFGWSYYEGSHLFSSEPPPGVEIIPPITEYSHQFGCSVTGGQVYRGNLLPAWRGIYLFGDYCTGRVWGLWRDAQGTWQQQGLFENMGRITSFGEDEQGEIYLVDHGGIIYRLAAR